MSEIEFLFHEISLVQDSPDSIKPTYYKRKLDYLDFQSLNILMD